MTVNFMDENERLRAVVRILAAPTRDSSPPNTPEFIRRTFSAYGITMTSWAKYFGFSLGSVEAVLRRPVPQRGEAHKVAILLGIKTDGIIIETDPGLRERMRSVLGDERVLPQTDF